MKIIPNSFYTTYNTQVDAFINQALAEDIGSGDQTSLSCLSNDLQSKGFLIAKDIGILAGLELALHIFKRKNQGFKFSTSLKDGDSIHKGQVVLEIEGPQLDLLATERVVLNSMQRMSGIATLTHNLKEKIKHTHATLLDTRKTTPNFRYPEKWAVCIGGGQNHRMGLFDMILIKDNHIDFCGNVTLTLTRVKKYLESLSKKIPVIVEVRNLKEIKEVLKFPWVTRLLLDNMSASEMKEAIRIIDGKFPTEASGNITEKNIVEVAETGVDYISLGMLTHSAENIDLSLKSSPLM